METQLLETWAIHHRINLYLLNSLEESHLADTASGKGRTVGEQFAHIHNVRIMWLQAANPGLLKGLHKIEKDYKLTKARLTKDLNGSAKAVRELLEQGIQDRRIKNFKPHPVAFLGYLISHESHHRGQVMVCLKQSGHAADKKIAFGMWEWGAR